MIKSFVLLVVFFLLTIFAPIKSNAQAIFGQYPTTGQVPVGVTGSVPLFTNTPAISALAIIPSASYSAVTVSTSFSPVNTSFLVINGTGTLTLTSTPTVSTTTAVSGQELTFLGGANPVTFTDNATLSGSLLKLGATTRALAVGDTLTLVYYNGLWYEKAFANNQ
jgi:hypothetical protein